jgi:hypothetical protein
MQNCNFLFTVNAKPTVCTFMKNTVDSSELWEIISIGTKKTTKPPCLPEGFPG